MKRYLPDDKEPQKPNVLEVEVTSQVERVVAQSRATEEGNAAGGREGLVKPRLTETPRHKPGLAAVTFQTLSTAGEARPHLRWCRQAI